MRIALIGVLLFLCVAFLPSCTDKTIRLPSESCFLLELSVEDHSINPIATITCTNISDSTVSVAKKYITDNYMEESFFSITEQFSVFDTSLQAEFIGNINQAPKEGFIQLKKGSAIHFKFDLRKFYRFLPEMNTNLFISYRGPLGTSSPRTLYLTSDLYKHYGKTNFTLNKTESSIVADLTFTNDSSYTLFLPRSFFPSDEILLIDNFFAISADNAKDEAPFLAATSFFPLYFTVADCIEIPSGKSVNTRLTLSSFYLIPQNAKHIQAGYYGYVSPVAFAELRENNLDYRELN